jgi:hypothetical protein
MEAILIVEGIGGWKSFVEIEESLTLDELLFLHKYLMKNKHNHYKMLAAMQGVDVGDFDEGDSDDELPEEVLAAERAWKVKKQAAIDSGLAAQSELSEFGLGYTKA